VTVLSEGDKAPAFALPDQDGETVKLSDLRGETVVLYFYPRADTPGCTTQACGVRDRRADYEAAGARVIGISPDEVGAIDKFAGKYDLGFTLLADADHAVAEKYGAWVEKSMYGRKYMGIFRTTYLIGLDGRIAKVWENVKVAGHAEDVLAAAKAL
jgi:peroxiredoxin Q/BCP